MNFFHHCIKQHRLTYKREKPTSVESNTFSWSYLGQNS